MRVSQKIFLKNDEGKFLALRRSATDPSRPLTWDLPGGNVEEGEDLAESIEREVVEETGIKITDATVFDVIGGTSKKGEYSIQIAYVAEVAMPKVVLSYEHDEYQWLTKEEFLELDSTDKIQKFLQKL